MPGGHDSSEKKSRRRFFSCFCAKSLDEPVAFQAEPEELYPEYADAPKAFRCPITMQIMLEPVSTCDGHTYEKSAIEEWLRVKKTSPVTGQRLRSTELLFNHALKVAIQRWIEEKEGKRKQAMLPIMKKQEPDEPDFFAQISSNAAMFQRQLQDGIGQSMSALDGAFKASTNALGQAAAATTQWPQFTAPLFQPQQQQQQQQPSQPPSRHQQYEEFEQWEDFDQIDLDYDSAPAPAPEASGRRGQRRR